MDKVRCSERIFDVKGFYRQCSRKGVVESSGRWYCKQHAPAAQKERDDESSCKYQAADIERAKLLRIESAAPDLLAACEAAIPVLQSYNEQAYVIQQLKNAIALAVGGE